METSTRNLRSKRALLIFNPQSGLAIESPRQLKGILSAMQAAKFITEVILIQPDFDVARMVQNALRRGIRMFVVSGGDGTIETVAQQLLGTRATLGIIPTGTQNNLALSLGIPSEIPAAVALLRSGKRIKIDVGLASCGEMRQSFLEVASVGLLSALFPAADEIQHGNLVRIGDFLSTLVSSPPAHIHLVCDGKQELDTEGHVVLVANMPFFGAHYQVPIQGTISDGFLDVLVFSNLTKLELLQAAGNGMQDPRIFHCHVHEVDILTEPLMPVLADGVSMGEGALHIQVQSRALTVMAGRKSQEMN